MGLRFAKNITSYMILKKCINISSKKYVNRKKNKKQHPNYYKFVYIV